MSFIINFFTNMSQSNVVNKEISEKGSASGVLRNGTSITDPIVQIELSSTNGMSFSDINYVYIEEFHRYYYVTSIRSVYNNMWEIACHVDVLMSFKDQILSQNAIVARQEQIYNLYLDDGFFMTYQNPKIQIKTFSNATPFETQEFVLVIAGS